MEGNNQRSLFTLLMVGCVTLALVIVIGAHLYLTTLKDYFQSQNQSLQLAVKEANTAVAELTQREEKEKVVTAKLHFITQLRLMSFRAVFLLNQLGGMMPANVSLNQVVRENNLVTLIGESASEEGILELIKNLNKAEMFTPPVLTFHQINEKHIFQLQMKQKG